MQPSHLLFIGLGGAAGAVGRYLLFVLIEDHAHTDFPLGTLCVNVLGCFLIGLLGTTIGGADHPLNPGLRLALIVGLLGGFTTFSTFGLETFELLLGGQHAKAALYVLASNALGLGAVWAGYALAQPMMKPAG